MGEHKRAARVQHREKNSRSAGGKVAVEMLPCYVHEVSLGEDKEDEVHILQGEGICDTAVFGLSWDHLRLLQHDNKQLSSEKAATGSELVDFQNPKQPAKAGIER